MKKNIVILGGGVGGISTAYNLKKLSKDINITILSKRPYFGFTPSYPHVAIGWANPKNITIDLNSLLPKFGINFINENAETIEPENNKVITESKKEIYYDYLVIATGPKLNFDAEGQKENAYSVCTLEHSQELNKKLNEFYNNPGPIVIGAIPGVSCFGPAYEFSLMLHYELKKRGLRTKVPITYITSEPYLGHLGLGGIGPSKRLMEDLFDEKSIKYITNVKIKKVDKDKIIYEDLNGNSFEIESKLSMIMPRFTGPDVVASAGDKVAHPVSKMVIVNEHFQNPNYKNIFAVGVVVFIPPVEKTPIPVGVPKVGMMIEQMSLAVANNIINDIKNSSLRYTPELSAICIADGGEEAVGFFASPVIPPRNTVKFKRAKILHYFKYFVERYFIFKVKSGNIEPFWEKMALKFMFNVKPINKTT